MVYPSFVVDSARQTNLHSGPEDKEFGLYKFNSHKDTSFFSLSTHKSSETLGCNSLWPSVIQVTLILCFNPYRLCGCGQSLLTLHH